MTWKAAYIVIVYVGGRDAMTRDQEKKHQSQFEKGSCVDSFES